MDGIRTVLVSLFVLAITSEVLVNGIDSICPSGRVYGCTCHDGRVRNSETPADGPVRSAVSTVNCTNPTFEKIPPDLPQSHVLWITGCNFAVFDQVPDTYASVVTLDLPNNMIRVIKGSPFKSLINVTSLNLQNNEIDDLTTATFAGLRSVEILDLSGNRLLGEIPAGVFTPQVMPNILEVKLSNCSLSSVDDDAFANASKINYIGLANNKLTKIPILSASAPLRKLHTLILSHNRITNLRGLKNMPELRVLLLSNNDLGHIKNGAFDDVSTNLTHIDLRYNHITVIEPTAFTKLFQLTELNLDHNKLKRVFWEELPWDHGLSRISLSGNTWTCDCHNAYLMEGHEFIDTYHKKEKKLRCAAPKDVAGRSIYDVPKSRFLCDNRPHKHKKRAVTTALFVLTALLLLAISLVVIRRMVTWRKTKKEEALGVYTRFSTNDSRIQYVDPFSI